METSFPILVRARSRDRLATAVTVGGRIPRSPKEVELHLPSREERHVRRRARLSPAALLLLLAAAFVSGAAAVAAPASAPTTGSFGRVDFANSGAALAQADFAAGLALLHDFEYPAAAEAFRRAQTADPGFVMAYWGEAMTYNHPVWMQQDAAAARATLARLAPTAAERQAKAATARERAYLAAVEILYAEESAGKESGEEQKRARDFRYAEAMASLQASYPDDVDAAARELDAHAHTWDATTTRPTPRSACAPRTSMPASPPTPATPCT